MSYLAAQALAGREATLYFATGTKGATFRPYLLPGTVMRVRSRKGIGTVHFRLPTPPGQVGHASGATSPATRPRAS